MSTASKVFTGFAAWDGSGTYYDDTTLGSFTLLKGGSGYIKNLPVSWTAPQTISGMTAGNMYYIYIDANGTIGTATSFSLPLFTDYILLFQCLRDAASPTNNQITVKENHPYQIPANTSVCLHNLIGPVIENNNLGAVIIQSGATGIAIAGQDVMADHGLQTTIPDSSGAPVAFNIMYTIAGAQWARNGSATTAFSGLYNNSGTPTALGGTKYGVYRLYVSKNDLNSATPHYFAVMDTQQYDTLGDANNAITSNTPARATNELARLEIAQLGYIVYEKSSESIVNVVVAKDTLKQSYSTAAVTIEAEQLRTFSNALSYLTTNNSNTLLYLDRTDSNAKLFLTKNNSNTLLYLTKNNSNALLFGDKNNSNAWLHWTATNTNYLVELAKYNSTTLIYLNMASSAALLYLNKNDSNTILYLERTDSNAKLFLTKNNSNTLNFLARNNSNTLLFLERNNSNALLFSDRNNSNTLLYILRTFSNAIPEIINNSNSIVWLDTQLQTIDHGPNNIIVNSLTYTMSYDIYLSLNHTMSVQTDTVIDGNGHVINFACQSPNILHIADGITVTFKNVVLKNYIDSALQLGTGSTIIFDNQTALMLAQSQQMLHTWNFVGNGCIFGYGNLLTIYPSNSIVVSPHSRLDIHDTSLDGLYLNNIRCSGATATVAFQNCGLLLDNDISFTTGIMEFGQDNYIRGTNLFSYESESTLTVTSNSRLVMDGITFRYAPSTNNRNLFVLLDRSAQLFIDGITLASTTTGMQLTRGTLIVDHTNQLVNDGATSMSEGFVFGNHNFNDDLTIQIKPGGSLNLISGTLDYKNADVNLLPD